jgi:hypothetical protein
MKRVVIHIESLVLNGFRYEDRHTIAAALQEELTRVLAAPMTARQLASSGNRPRLRLGNVHFAPKTKPREVGAATGRAVAQGLLQ